MFFLSMFRRTVFSFVIPVVLLAQGASAGTDGGSFYEAYYLQHHHGEMAKAAAVYAEALEGGQLDAELMAAAKLGLTQCREELACSDFARLMPEDALAYIELNKPGEQLGDLLDKLGLLSDGANDWAKPGQRYLSISPTLIKELAGVRGVAIAITGVDPVAQAPAGVAVLHPGSVDAIRGLLETALPVAAASVAPIENRPTYLIEDKVFVTLTSRLIVVSAQRQQIADALQRLDGQAKKSLKTNAAMTEVLAARGNSLLFLCVNAKPVVPMIKMFAGASEELTVGNAVLDLDSLKWIAAKVGVEEDGPQLELSVRYDEGQQNLAYNMLRTPPISREILASIPRGAAGFIASALGESTGGRGGNEGGNGRQAIIGLDFGRELFANIVDFAVFAVPPKSDSKSSGPAPDVSLVIRVHDPSKSEKLWQQVLGIITMAAGAPTTDGVADSIEGATVRAYRFPEGVNVFFATIEDRVIFSTSRYAAEQAISTIQGGASILTDEVFAPGIARMTESTSKAISVHPRRVLEVAYRFLSERERRDVDVAREVVGDLVATAMTDESDELFRLSVSASGLPNVGPIIAAQIQREFDNERLHSELNTASRKGQWDKALRALDQLEEMGESNSNIARKRIEIMAAGKADREATVAAVTAFMESFSNHANAMNTLAWDFLTEEKFGGKYNDLALELASKACEVSHYKNWAVLDTAALAHFKTGNVAKAIELQELAIKHGGGKSDEVKERLEQYRSASGITKSVS